MGNDRVASGPAGKGTGVRKRSGAGVAVAGTASVVDREGTVGVSIASRVSVSGVIVAIVADFVPAGVGGSDSTDEVGGVQALIRSKAAKVMKTEWRVVGLIFLQRPILRSLTICLPAMLNAQDDYKTFVLVNLVDNAIVTYADAPLVFTITQLLHTGWSRGLIEDLQTSCYALL
jgi:hypothetical protein